MDNAIMIFAVIGAIGCYGVVGAVTSLTLESLYTDVTYSEHVAAVMLWPLILPAVLILKIVQEMTGKQT
jgi:hypothetical protein